jgi:hypothetical protein
MPNHKGYEMRRMNASSICISLLILFLILFAASDILGQKKEQKKTHSAVGQMDKKAPGKEVNMGYLQTRDKIVMISRGAKGSLYTVKSKDGKVLSSKINERDFEDKYPVLFRQVKNGLAGNDATLRKIESIPFAPPK